MIWLLYAVCAAAAGYQIVALAAVVRHLFRRDPANGYAPRVSILKPLAGCDPFLEEAVRSHQKLDYPNYEILCGVGSMDDPAAEVAARLGLPVYACRLDLVNRKVAALVELASQATGEALVVNDADIRVTPDYLKRVIAPLQDAGVGLVTCLYRPIPLDLAAGWEAIGIATDFAPSTLVAPLVGIDEFGLGSTLCFRAADLRKAGGFEPIGDYLADDFQLARRLTRGLGKRAVMSRLVVDTAIAYGSWGQMWRHQVRWARTIGVSRAESFGLPVTHAGLWALVALMCGQPGIAVGLLCLRMLTGFVASVHLLRSPVGLALPLIPVWDLFAFATWVAARTGDTIEWRGHRFRLTKDGRLVR